MSDTAPRHHTILIAIKGLGLGGAERLISQGAKCWDRTEFDYHVAYGLPWKNQLVPALAALDVPTHMIGGRRGLDPMSPRRLRATIRATGADLVHAHLPMMGVVARLASPVPVVYTEHNVASSYRLPTRLANRLTYGRNASVTAVSDEVARSLTGYPGPDPIVVRNGVAPLVEQGVRALIRAELGIDEDTPLVVHVGNIRPHKGHDTLIEAVATMRYRVPEILVVSIGGEKHVGDLERVTSAARHAGVDANLRFLGRRQEAAAYIAAADVLVNPSDIEGLPLAVLEAMAIGTPVAATAVGGVPSLIKDGETGLLVDPRNPRRLAAATIRLIEEPFEARRYAEAAKELVSESYSLDGMVRSHEALYRDLLDG